jgi:hypothetical protein
MTVLSSPGSREVRPVWNYFVFAFYILISLDSSSLKILVVKSALEHKTKFKISLNCACAISCLKKSVNLLILSLPPIVVDGGIAATIFVYP